MKERTLAVLRELSGVEKIKESDELQNHLMLDSLNMVMLLVELEEEFGFQLNESDMNPFQLQYVGDVINLVNKYLGEKNEKES